jgi:hypothetical protein
MEDDDFGQLSATYRDELKLVLKRIDESLAPHRAKAEEAARAHLAKVGLTESGDRGAVAGRQAAGEDVATKGALSARTSPQEKSETTTRVTCPSCGESNERDAKFCKECATKLTTDSKAKEAAGSTSNSETEDSDEE